MYMEGIAFSVLLFLLPILSFKFFLAFIGSYLVVALAFAIFAAWSEKRWELLLVPAPYLLLVFINSYIFLEQMVQEVFMGKKNLSWFQPERYHFTPLEKAPIQGLGNTSPVQARSLLSRASSLTGFTPNKKSV